MALRARAWQALPWRPYVFLGASRARTPSVFPCILYLMPLADGGRPRRDAHASPARDRARPPARCAPVSHALPVGPSLAVFRPSVDRWRGRGSDAEASRPDFNHRLHSALFGLTPHEVLHGEIPDHHRFLASIRDARLARIAGNKAVDCATCAPLAIPAPEVAPGAATQSSAQA